MKHELAAEIRSFFRTPHKATAYLATVDSTRDFSPEVRPITLMELEWQFYVATTAGTRKVREMATHSSVAALVMFQKDNVSGYLRIAGKVTAVDDVTERKRITDAVSYDLECHWKGAGDPKLAFFRIVPERIEYMRPGEDDAKEVAAALLPATPRKP